MSPEENGWSEYKRLLLADRDVNKEFRREVREFMGRLDRRMIAIEEQRNAGRWFISALAAVVSGVVGTGVAVAGILWR